MCFVLRSQSIAIFPSIPRLPRDASLCARPPGATGGHFGGANVPAKLRLAWRALWRCCEGSFTAAQFVTPCAWGDDHGTALARGAGCMVPRHPKASLRVAVSPQRVACPQVHTSHGSPECVGSPRCASRCRVCRDSFSSIQKSSSVGWSRGRGAARRVPACDLGICVWPGGP